MSRRRLAIAAATLLLLALASAAVIRSGASFTSSASHPQSVAAVADFVAPSASRAIVQKTQGGVPGYVRPGGSYRLYATVADSGNPPSGVASATADVSALTTGVRAAALSAGSATIAGQTYNRMTSTLSAGSGLAPGAAGFSLALADAAGNAAAQAFTGVVVDATAPRATDVQGVSSGATGTPSSGDTVTFTFSEPVDPISLVGGWDGGATAVTADIANNGSTDVLSVSRGGTQVPLGSVALNANVVGATTAFNASLQASGATVVLTLGSLVSGSTRSGSSAAMRWSPSTAAFDRAGNSVSSTAVTESGSSDRDF